MSLRSPALFALVVAAAGCSLDRVELGGSGADAGPGIDAQVAIDASSEGDGSVARDAHLDLDGAPIDGGEPDGGSCVTAPAGEVYAPPLAVTIDGSLEEWPDAAFVETTDWDGLRDPPPMPDLSLRFAVAWSLTAVYLAIEVRDDEHDNVFGGPTLYLGDSVQVGLDVGRNAAGAYYDSTDDFEYGWALVGESLERWRWVQPIGAAPPTDTVRITRDGSITRYEIELRALDLGRPSIAAGDAMRMGMILNESDGEGRDGWLEWASGIGSVKDPREFRELTMVSAAICE